MNSTLISMAARKGPSTIDYRRRSGVDAGKYPSFGFRFVSFSAGDMQSLSVV